MASTTTADMVTPPVMSNTEPWSVQGALASFSVEPVTTNGIPKSPITFLHIIERLKTSKRAGWARFGIQHQESIADHMYRMSIMTMLAPKSLADRLDIPRCTRMALVHDMAESLVGDITPVDGISKPEKARREAATMDYLCDELLGNVDGGHVGREIKALFKEYEESETLESEFVHAIDKIELLFQRLEYERTHKCTKDLETFSWVASTVKLPELKAWLDDLQQEREEMWASARL